MSLSSSSSVRASPSSPGWYSRGDWCVAVAKKAVALPAAAAARDDDAVAVLEDLADRSAVSRSRITVPTGTGITTSSPERPVLLVPEPWSPRRRRPRIAIGVVEQRRRGCSRRRRRCRRRGPPSPPSGPPIGTNFSRRNETMPEPPSPAFTSHNHAIDEHDCYFPLNPRPEQMHGRARASRPSRSVDRVERPRRPRPAARPAFSAP